MIRLILAGSFNTQICNFPYNSSDFCSGIA